MSATLSIVAAPVALICPPPRHYRFGHLTLPFTTQNSSISYSQSRAIVSLLISLTSFSLRRNASCPISNNPPSRAFWCTKNNQQVRGAALITHLLDLLLYNTHLFRVFSTMITTVLVLVLVLVLWKFFPRDRSRLHSSEIEEARGSLAAFPPYLSRPCRHLLRCWFFPIPRTHHGRDGFCGLQKYPPLRCVPRFASVSGSLQICMLTNRGHQSAGT
jgi:hypothetical protein